MSRKRDEDEDESQENLMVLRLPEKYAQIVRQAVNKGNLRERLQIDIKDDCRNALLKIENETLTGKLVDLPCIMECQKTIDNKTFYKSGDICQMLLVNETPLAEEEVSRSQQVRKEKNDHKKFIYPHGITPPMKNVRKKRFRKTAPKKIIDDPEVEKEVRRLLRADISAISVQTRLVYDNKVTVDTSKPAEAAQSSFQEESRGSDIGVVGGGEGGNTCDLSKMLDDTLTADTSTGNTTIAAAPDDKSFDKELMEMFQDLSSDDQGSSGDEGNTTRLESVPRPMDTSNSASQDAIFERETLDRKIKGLENEISRTTNSFLQKRLQDDLENLKKLRLQKEAD